MIIIPDKVSARATVPESAKLMEFDLNFEINWENFGELVVELDWCEDTDDNLEIIWVELCEWFGNWSGVWICKTAIVAMNWFKMKLVFEDMVLLF